jgi:hypothetical protein
LAFPDINIAKGGSVYYRLRFEGFTMKLGEVDVKSPLKHWEEILEQWVRLNREIFEHAKGKFAAYSYRERPNVGVMAGAAVRAGWVALEECWSEKEGASGVRNGRADLWLWRDIHHERIEAKFTTDGPSELIKKNQCAA